jgi:small subunit ribosomal protein S4
MLITPGDEIAVREGSRKRTFFKELAAVSEERSIPDWVTRDVKNLKGTITRLPERSEIDGNLNEQLIVEYYKR